MPGWIFILYTVPQNVAVTLSDMIITMTTLVFILSASQLTIKAVWQNHLEGKNHWQWPIPSAKIWPGSTTAISFTLHVCSVATCKNKEQIERNATLHSLALKVSQKKQRHLHCFHACIAGNGFTGECATIESLFTNPFGLAFLKKTPFLHSMGWL